MSQSHCVLLLNCALIVGFVKIVRWISLKFLHGFVRIDKWISLSCYMDFSKVKYGFIKIDTWIFLGCYMDLLKLLHVFVKVVQCISCPLPNKPKLKFDQDFKVC